MRKIGAHAVVVGASMGGAPQGRQYHALLPSGAGILEQLFPGLIADLVSGETPVVSDFSQARVSLGGHPMCDQAAPMPGGLVQASRSNPPA